MYILVVVLGVAFLIFYHFKMLFTYCRICSHKRSTSPFNFGKLAIVTSDPYGRKEAPCNKILKLLLARSKLNFRLCIQNTGLPLFYFITSFNKISVILEYVFCKTEIINKRKQAHVKSMLITSSGKKIIWE